MSEHLGICLPLRCQFDKIEFRICLKWYFFCIHLREIHTQTGFKLCNFNNLIFWAYNAHDVYFGYWGLAIRKVIDFRDFGRKNSMHSCDFSIKNKHIGHFWKTGIQSVIHFYKIGKRKVPCFLGLDGTSPTKSYHVPPWGTYSRATSLNKGNIHCRFIHCRFSSLHFYSKLFSNLYDFIYVTFLFFLLLIDKKRKRNFGICIISFNS